MQKKLLEILTAVALAAALAACGAEQPAHSDASTGDLPTLLTIQTVPAAQTSETTETTEMTESASVDAITSLADWDKLNADGTYSERTRAFLGRFLGENTTGIAEFDTVQISDYRIARREPEDGINTLLFTFTVDASGLDTLPSGQYETVVEERLDTTMVFLGDDPRDAAYPAAGEGCDNCSETYYALREACYGWSYPIAYGAWNAENCHLLPAEYIVNRYGNHDKMARAPLPTLPSGCSAFRGSLYRRFRRRTRTVADGCIPAASAAAFMPCLPRIA